MNSTFYWSVRRELWEHRSVWLAPLSVAILVIVAFAIGATGHLQLSGFANIPADKKLMLVAAPFSLSASVVLVTAFVLGAFYSLDALNSERKDRSILFWKSMPVSDATTVLSKAVIPVAIIPPIALAIALAMQAVLLVVAGIVLKSKGIEAAPLYEMLPLKSIITSLAYGVMVHALWYAPAYALFLLASVATRRPLLWIVVPTVVVQVLEKVAFNTSFSGEFIKWRLLGAMNEAFKPLSGMKEQVPSLAQLDPARFFSSLGLWLGLAAAVVFLFIAIRLRRRQEPL
jgi:ABC-2 type transport system permease protein